MNWQEIKIEVKPLLSISSNLFIILQNQLFSIGLPKEGPSITGIKPQQYGTGDLGTDTFQINCQLN